MCARVDAVSGELEGVDVVAGVSVRVESIPALYREDGGARGRDKGHTYHLSV